MQEVHPPVTGQFPVYHFDRMQMSETPIDVHTHTFLGKVQGCTTNLSPAANTGFSSVAGLTPTFLTDSKQHKRKPLRERSLLRPQNGASSTEHPLAIKRNPSVAYSRLAAPVKRVISCLTERIRVACSEWSPDPDAYPNGRLRTRPKRASKIFQLKLDESIKSTGHLSRESQY